MHRLFFIHVFSYPTPTATTHRWLLADMLGNMSLGAFTHEITLAQRFSDFQTSIQTFSLFSTTSNGFAKRDIDVILYKLSLGIAKRLTNLFPFSRRVIKIDQSAIVNIRLFSIKSRTPQFLYTRNQLTNYNIWCLTIINKVGWCG